MGEDLVGQIDHAKAGRLGPGERAAVGQALAGEDAAVLAGNALVLAVEIADFAAAHADVAGGHVAVGTDVAVELGHKALAETHDLAIALPLGVEVAAAFAAADGQAGEGVLEDLLKAQKFHNALVHARMAAQAALVGADGAVKLHPEAAVDLIFPLVVHPGHPEGDDALGLHQTLQQLGVTVFGVLLHHAAQRAQDLGSGLKELRLVGVLFFDGG